MDDFKRRDPPRNIYFGGGCNSHYGYMGSSGFSVGCDRIGGHSGWHQNRVSGVVWADPWSKARWGGCPWKDCGDWSHVVDEREDGNGMVHVCPGHEGAHHFPRLTRAGAE